MSMNQLITELPSLVAWFPMTEGTGTTVNDYAGSTNITTSAVNWRKIPSGEYSLDFSGSTSAVGTMNQPLDIGTGQAVTIAFWLLTTSTTPNNQWIISNQNSASTTSRMVIGMGTTDPSKLYFFNDIGATTNEINSTTSLNDGVWHFCVCTRDSSGNNAIYIDGNTTPEATSTNAGDVSDGTGWILGKYSSATTISFAGTIANLMIASEAWSAELIAQIYRKTYIQ